MRSSLGDRGEDRGKDRKRECRATSEDEIERLRHRKGAGRVRKRSPWVRNMVGRQPMEVEAKGSMNQGQNRRREPKSEKARDWWHAGRTAERREEEDEDAEERTAEDQEEVKTRSKNSFMAQLLTSRCPHNLLSLDHHNQVPPTLLCQGHCPLDTTDRGQTGRRGESV
jgi:hypothetical protein